MRKIFNSKLATIAAAGIIVALSGGTGAYAATQINGDSIMDNTIDSTELQNGTVTTKDLGTGSVTSSDIAADSVTTTDLAPAVEGAVDTVNTQVDQAGNLPGSLITMWTDQTCRDAVNSGCDLVTSQGSTNMLVYLDVQNTGDKPERVSINNGEMFCVADPGASCQSVRRLDAMNISVDGWGIGTDPNSNLDVQVNVVYSPLG